MRNRLPVIFLALFVLLACSAAAFGTDIWDTKYVNVRKSTETSDGVMAVSLAPGIAFRLIEVRLHLDSASASAESLTVAIDSNAGEGYDVSIFSQDLNTYQDLVWVPEVARYFDTDDQLDFAWANSEAITWGLEVLYEETFGRP